MSEIIHVWGPLAVSLLALLVSVLSFRHNRGQSLAKQPYLNKLEYAQRDLIALAGPNAEDWALKSIKILWPPRAQFMKNDLEHDTGGSISQSWLTPIGRTLPDHSLPLIFSEETSAVFLIIKARSRTRQTFTKRWLVKAKRTP